MNNPIGIGYLTTTNGHAPRKAFIKVEIFLANNGNGLVVNELAKL